VRNFQSAEKLLEALHTGQCNILILDINLPQKSGLDILPEIRRDYPDMWILVLTMYNSPAILNKAKEQGVHGVLLKDFGEQDLLKALNDIITTGKYQNPVIKNYDEDSADASKVLFLTKREKEIITLTAQGKTSSEIAEILFLSPHTVNTHRRNIYKKLDITNIKELITVANANGLQ